MQAIRGPGSLHYFRELTYSSWDHEESIAMGLVTAGNPPMLLAGWEDDRTISQVVAVTDWRPIVRQGHEYDVTVLFTPYNITPCFQDSPKAPEDATHQEDINDDLPSVAELLALSAAAETAPIPIPEAPAAPAPVPETNTSHKRNISAATSRNAREGEANARTKEKRKARAPTRYGR
jgi:hypothetical protein